MTEQLYRTAAYLRDCGFDVVEAGNADEAVRVLEAGIRIDIVFSDVNMPGSLDGFGLAQWLCRERPGLKIILTSGAAQGAKDASDPCAPVPILAHGTSPACVHPQRVRGETPSIFAASRGRSASGGGELVVMAGGPTGRVPRRAARIPVGGLFGSELPNSTAFAGKCQEIQGIAGIGKNRRCSVSDAERSNTERRLLVGGSTFAGGLSAVHIMRRDIAVQ